MGGLPGPTGVDYGEIGVDPENMYFEMLFAMGVNGKAISDSVNRVVQVWNGLKLGWVGNTADEMEAFNRAWSGAVAQLFGTAEDPQTGVLSRIGAGVARASVNYGETENVVTKMFRDMSAALGGKPALAGEGDGTARRNLTDGPITEVTG